MPTLVDEDSSATIGLMTDASLSRGAIATDSFGVPDRLLGPHTDEFYACVGRVVTLSALFEERVCVLVSQQVGVTQAPPKLGGTNVSTLIRKGLAHVDAFVDEPSRFLADAFFAHAQVAIRERNHIVHNLWPVQAEGPHFGWRSIRGESADIMINRSQSDLRELVLQIVKLLDDCENLSMRVSVPKW
jgi:hypothetical protein